MLPVKTVLGLCNTEKDQIHGRKVEKTSFVHETYSQKHIPSGTGQQYGKAQ